MSESLEQGIIDRIKEYTEKHLKANGWDLCPSGEWVKEDYWIKIDMHNPMIIRAGEFYSASYGFTFTPNQIIHQPFASFIANPSDLK